MNEVEAIVHELRNAFEGEPWHGPSLFDILGRLTPEMADQRGSNSHSPWQVALHVGAWVPAVHRRLEGGTANLTPEQDWPAVVETSPEAWSKVRADIEADYRSLVGFIADMKEEALEATVVGKTYDARFMLHGLAQHVAYHAGQISLLAKTGPEMGRGLLRHTLAVLAYRGGKVLRNAPEGFADFDAGAGTRTPVQVLSHIGDLFEWCVSLADGGHRWNEASANDWPSQVARFHVGLAAVDARLLDPRPMGCSAERLIQGPIADALTHIGQISLMRRLAGNPVKGENYFKADITVGVLGPSQPPPRREFD